jgi:MFS family permease
MAQITDSTTSLPQLLADKRAAVRVFIIASMIMLATMFSPPFMRMLGSTAWTSIGWTEVEWSVFSATRGLVFIIFVLVAGVGGDFWGRRRVLLWSLAGFILCMLLLAILPVGSAFLIVFTVTAILGVMLRTLTITLIILAFPSTERVVVPVIIYSALAGLGVIISPIFSKAIVRMAGLTAVYFLPLILAFAGFVLTLKYIPESRAAGDLKKMNVIALVIWTFGLCVLIFAGVLAGGLGWTNPLVIGGLIVGGGLIIILKWLDGVTLPEKWRFKLLFQRQLSVAVYAGVILNVALYAITVQVFNFLNEVQDYNAILAGLALAPILAGAVLVVALSARLAFQWRLAQALSASLLVIAVPATVLSLLSPDISYWVLLPSLMLLGFGFILGNSPRLLLLSSSVPLNLSATVQAIGSATAQLGGALAYSFMLTLVHGFGMQAVTNELQSIGLSNFQISSQLLLLVEASEEISALFPSATMPDLTRPVDLFLQQIYVVGLARAMLALAGVCLFSAIIVYLGLRKRE